MPYVVLSILWFAFLLYCLLDIALSDDASVRGLPKLTWVIVLVFLPLVGGIAWLVAGRPARAGAAPGSTRATSPRPGGNGRVGGGRPAPGRAPLGPDDDPAFLRRLEEQLRDDDEA